jgi:ribosome-binding protein aMBF1 (putative translation factor)
MSMQQQVAPIFIDRCCPQCKTPSGKIAVKNTYATFNHHCVGRLLTDEADIRDILIELVGTAITVCTLCTTKIRKQAKTFNNVKATLLHHIESHLSEDDQVKLYKYIDERFPVPQGEQDFPDNMSVRSGFSSYSQMSRGSLRSLRSDVNRVAFSPQQLQQQQSPQQVLPGIPEITSEEAFLAEFPELTLIDYYRYLRRERERRGIILMGTKPSGDSRMDITKG